MAGTSAGWIRGTIDNASFCCTLVGIEECSRSLTHFGPTMPWYLWSGFIGVGVVLSFLGDKGPKLWRSIAAWPGAPKRLADALAENVELKKQLAQGKPSTTKIPQITGEFSNVQIISHGLITKQGGQHWMKCEFCISVSLSSSSAVGIDEIKLRTHRHSPPCLSLSAAAQPQITKLDGSSSYSFMAWPQIEYLYDGTTNALPESLDMVVIDEFGAEHLIYLKQGQTLPSLPGFPSGSAGREAALVFDGFGPWKSGFSFGVPLGVQDLSVVTVRNNQLASAKEIHNVRARIEYLHDGKSTFAIERATWWSEQVTDQGTYRKLHRAAGVDLKANESQPFPVFMQGRTTKYPQSAVDNDSETHDLDLGRWTAKITVTADFCDPIYGEIEFTVFQEAIKNTLSIGMDPPLGIVRLPFTR
jgi:hypothetical protein